MQRKQIQKKLKRLKKVFLRQVRLAFFPHKANQYRPYIIRRYSLAAIVVVVLGLQIGYNVTTTGTVLGSGAAITPEELLQDTNNERAKNSLQPLQGSPRLADAAFMKAKDMFAKQYWAHQSPTGVAPWQWLSDANYNYSHAGENLARNFATADATTVAWMASSDHRSNILGAQYSEVGFAVVDGILDDKPTTLIVAFYADPAAQPVVAGAQTPVATAPIAPNIGLLTRLGVVVQSFTPAALGTIVVMIILAIVAGIAHLHRDQLPAARRQSKLHHQHGVVKGIGMLSLVIIVIALSSGGQI